MNGDSTLQNPSGVDVLAPAALNPGIVRLLIAASGTTASTSQKSPRVLPVLTPPCRSRPFVSRALTAKSTPFQCWIALGEPGRLFTSTVEFCGVRAAAAD